MCCCANNVQFRSVLFLEVSNCFITLPLDEPEAIAAALAAIERTEDGGLEIDELTFTQQPDCVGDGAQWTAVCTSRFETGAARIALLSPVLPSWWSSTTRQWLLAYRKM